MTAVLGLPAHGRWPRALSALGLVLAAVLWLYRDTLVAMVAIWLRSETFTHAFTVPPISLWLVWRQRARLARMTPRPVPWLLGVMVLAGLAWLAGELVSVNALTQFALVALVVLSVPALLGWEVAGAIRFPLLFLFFAVPFGEFLMPRLMLWTADFTVWALQLSGIPVLREGLQFSIPSGQWSVEAACSGIRYLMASVMVGVLFAYLNYQSMLRRWVFVGVSILVPIVANWIRAYLIVMTGHLSGNELATGADHLVYGWVFFGIVIMVMLGIGARWTQPESASAARRPAPAVPARAASGWSLAVVAAGALASLALPHSLLAHVQGTVPVALSSLEDVVAPAAGWTPAAAPAPDWRNGFVNPTLRLQRSYARDGAQAVGLQLAYYALETPDTKLVSSINGWVADTKPRAWAVVSEGQETVPTPQDTLTWRTAQLRPMLANGADSAAPRLLVWRIYWINGVFTASDAKAKALLAFNRLLGRGGDGVAIVLYTADTSPQQARAALGDFARDHLAPLSQQLQQARIRAGS